LILHEKSWASFDKCLLVQILIWQLIDKSQSFSSQWLYFCVKKCWGLEKNQVSKSAEESSNQLKLKSLIIIYFSTRLFILFYDIFHFTSSKTFQTACHCLASLPSITPATVFSCQYFYPLLRGPILLDPILLIQPLLYFCI